MFFPKNRQTKAATLKLKDSQNDIAILEITNFNGGDISLHNIPFSMADISTTKIGQEVFTLGFPLGEALGTETRLSSGKIDSLMGLLDDPRHFQISNPLQPGNSGGPLFNYKGEIVGIVVSGLDAKFLYDNFGIIPQNVNFAVKISFAINLLELMPEGHTIFMRKSQLSEMTLEEQIEKVTPFIIQVIAY